MLTDSNVV